MRVFALLRTCLCAVRLCAGVQVSSLGYSIHETSFALELSDNHDPWFGTCPEFLKKNALCSAAQRRLLFLSCMAMQTPGDGGQQPGCCA